MTPAPRTVTREDYGPGVKLLDALCAVLEWAGAPLGRLDAESMITAARKRTGLQDLGSLDFRTPLDHVVAAAQASSFTALARVITRQTFITALANRLRHEDWMARHPAAEQTELRRPIFILGFPRTGTTLLQNLLAQDDGARALHFWELQNPVPTSDDPVADRAKRLRTTRITLAAAYVLAPEMRSVHEIGAETAEECWPLFANTFSVMNWDLASGMKAYGEWLRTTDMVGPYREYRRQLQMIAAARPTRQFVLKCPEHLWFIDALLTVFPDAAIVWTHRDPLESVASYCSLVSLNRRMLYGKVDAPALGAHIEERFAEGVQRAMVSRDRHPQATFIDVDFRTLVKDTPGEIGRIKERLGIPHDGPAGARVEAWLASERGDKRGAHVYDAAHYGLEAARVHRRFQDYIERFQIPLRSSR